MSLNNIKFNIISSDNNYEYIGAANFLKDIITFKDKDRYVIDKTISNQPTIFRHHCTRWRCLYFRKPSDKP